MELQLVSLVQELVVSKHRFRVGFWSTIAIIGGNRHLLVLHQVEILKGFLVKTEVKGQNEFIPKDRAVSTF